MRTLFLILMFLFIPITSFAQQIQPRDVNNIKILSGQTIVGSGTSVVIIDLRDSRYYPVVEFDFSLQLSGITNTETSYLSGQTIDAIQFVTSNHMPSGNVAEGFSGVLSGNSEITAKLPWVTILDDMDIRTGNTEYPIPLYAEKGRLLIIRVISGASPILTDLWLDMD